LADTGLSIQVEAMARDIQLIFYSVLFFILQVRVDPVIDIPSAGR
jgi:hypothetical protein